MPSKLLGKHQILIRVVLDYHPFIRGYQRVFTTNIGSIYLSEENKSENTKSYFNAPETCHPATEEQELMELKRKKNLAHTNTNTHKVDLCM